MAKKILAIFFVSILLCSYIIPTTSAFADVVIGDNDSYAVTELGIQNGKKIATMEAMLQLLESGVSEINFNDISDLDDYLEEFYDELTNVNFTDVSNELLAGAYNDVKELKQWIDDRGEYIATYYKEYLNSADQGLSNIFNNFQMRIPKTKLTGTSLNGFRSLSRFNNSSPTPEVPPDLAPYINAINGTSGDGHDFFWKDYGFYTFNEFRYYCYNRSWFIPHDYANNSSYRIVQSNFQTSEINQTDNGYMRFDINGSDNSYSLTLSNATILNRGNGLTWASTITQNNISNRSASIGSAGWSNGVLKQGETLTIIFNYLVKNFRNVDIYMNNQPLSLVSGVITSPTLDIDGFVKLFGQNNPIQYDFPQNTQIDYNALYTTIYNAIRDNLPFDMQTVNNNQVYYDSHDTVYSPTIYNYYGKDGDDENDWIDSILDYATIPDFNAVLGTVAVLDDPFVNGITIVNTGVTDVIPTDILLILGGFFVLVLFVCIINRMSE